ncbi:hypothetical protein K443DRAFT_95157, partial [Laccaria amethystina LaAM-08-1]
LASGKKADQLRLWLRPLSTKKPDQTRLLNTICKRYFIFFIVAIFVGLSGSLLVEKMAKSQSFAITLTPSTLRPYPSSFKLEVFVAIL